MIRARPLLGTRVDIRAEHPSEETANAAITRGFDAIADIHRLMSFHEAASDISRLNREAAGKSVAVDPRTFEVLRKAQDLAKHSEGVFDITAAARLVAWGFLPRPAGAPAPAEDASWRDIVLEDLCLVRFRRPLWIDLGGIAKGYAVDQAIAAMALGPEIQVVVNAGGDLRVAGPRAEHFRLRSAIEMETVPVVELADGALASSSAREHLREHAGGRVGPYVHGRDRTSIGADAFVSVAAPDCATADGLTKVVIAQGPAAQAILGQFGAIAYFYAPNAGWVTLGG